MVGIGGGTLTVPCLFWTNLRMQEAVATSGACALPIAFAGATGFVFTGWASPQLPLASLGFDYLPPLLGIVLASILFAPPGAWLVHRLPANALRQIFAIVLVVLGIYKLTPH